MIRLGIDFGGSGIKGALINTDTGELIGERHRILTPDPSKPDAVARTIKEIIDHFEYKDKVGIAFPAAILHGKVLTASNIDDSWIGVHGEEFFKSYTDLEFVLLNDADSAGMAEIKFGHANDHEGVVIIVTVGTGLGTAIFNKSVLLPNTELGHVYYKGKIAEHWASDAARKEHDLSWKKWGKRFGKYLRYMEKLFYPDLIIIGGGASKKMENFEDYLKTDTKVVPAKLQNHAGIIGAALATL